jgi:hypothetical protein
MLLRSFAVFSPTNSAEDPRIFKIEGVMRECL